MTHCIVKSSCDVRLGYIIDWCRVCCNRIMPCFGISCCVKYFHECHLHPCCIIFYRRGYQFSLQFAFFFNFFTHNYLKRLIMSRIESSFQEIFCFFSSLCISVFPHNKFFAKTAYIFCLIFVHRIFRIL